MFSPHRPSRFTTATLLATAALGLAACAAEEEQLPESTPGAQSTAPDTAAETSSAPETDPSSSPSSESSSKDDYNQVPAGPFLDATGSNASIEMPLAGTNYFCTLGETAVACIATPDSSVPDLEDMPGNPWAPFTSRPGAVMATSDGISWGVLEGGAPGSGKLSPGERVEHKNGWCQVPDDESIECGFGTTSFTVSGPNRTVTEH